jgi:cytochrome c biogenesis protein CcmG, thiol:disulfide interchange protein DsbE
MSRWFILFCVCLLAASLQAAERIKFDQLKVGSQVYSNVTVTGMNASELFFTHSKGIANVKMKYLEPDVQKRLNFDHKAADAAEREHMQEDANFKNALATRIPNAAKPEAPQTPVSSEDNIADPVSDNSMLGKAAPKFEIEKWLGEKPDLKDKFVLLGFWAPWSFPAKKAIAQLSGLQKKFSKNLVVIALTSDSQDDVEAMTDPRIDFASTIDEKGKLRTAFRVTTVPTVVLIDPKGIVLYEGHPAALNEKQLQNILSKSE